ncbi:MAG TPA: YbhB/YbcL family Raf kinase inhibitor-like protein [Thermoplasmatales archaeon]|nr:YbhB/YbcL family Raf kinase inhibitor-like protein [Thermoplasmatales archaeon]
MAFSIRSPAFAHGASIPARYTCDGENVSPPLEWGDIPPEAESLALIVDDPDAPLFTWVHWLVYDMPADRTALPENVPPQEVLDDGTRQGTTSFRRIGYGGPCPPGRRPHRYHFRLYALDTAPDLPPGAKKRALTAILQSHLLATAETMGAYARR